MGSSARSSCSCDPRWTPRTRTEPAAQPLDGIRVLIVDDEFLIAAELEADLAAAGARVVGPAFTLDKALVLAARADVQAAVLDIQLGRDTVAPVVRALIARDIPFVFYTGQIDTDPIRAQWPTCGVVAKPASAPVLVAAVVRAIRRR